MVGNFLGCLFVLFILFGLLCNLTGDENKGMQIINNCVTAIVIYTEVYVTDNNSRNFTYINGNRLFPNNKNILVDGDELTLADQKFEVSICR